MHEEQGRLVWDRSASADLGGRSWKRERRGSFDNPPAPRVGGSAALKRG